VVPAFLRTLSARILVGFALLILTFGATMIWIVAYVNDLRSEIEVIRTRYLKLTIAAKDLASQQVALHSYLLDELPDEANPKQVVRRLHRLRDSRDDLLGRVVTTLESMRGLPRNHGEAMARYLERCAGMQRTVAQLEPIYTTLQVVPPIRRTLDANPPIADAAQLQASVHARDQLLDAEARLLGAVRDLADGLRSRTERIAENLEYNARRLRVFTGAMGVVAVLAGLMVTAWVRASLRPLVRLRTAARRVAAGDYASRIEEQGPAEVSDLAREFNAMGLAVEERERELVRSERLAAVGKMAAMITHEVRNPLSSIGLNAELLEDELGELTGGAGEEARSICRAITREVDRLTAITEEYLSLARLPKPRLAAGSASALVDDLARFVREDLASRAVELAVEHGALARPALMDEAQIRQALLNLVRNAAEAVAGQGGGHVWMRTRGTDTRVAIDVVDDGPGIPAELRERLFDPFVSTKDGGTGLGLAVTHQIVKDHGGAIHVTSSAGVGTTFTIELPAAPAA
jgi:two-component system NtrC family sensor kinase